MSVPHLGRYASADQAFAFDILSANPANGHIVGRYTAQQSPVGAFTLNCAATYRWVTHSTGSFTPFALQFDVCLRPDGREYCLTDSWMGYYSDEHAIVAHGSRAYVPAQGPGQIFDLGTVTFRR